MTEYNTDKMNREVYCYTCKTYSYSDELVPRCLVCKEKLFTVVRNAISEQRMGE